MNRCRTIYYWVLCTAIFWGGCELPPQTPPQGDYSDIEGITLDDLRPANLPQREQESLLTFSVLTYVLDTTHLDQLGPVFDSLSQQHIRFANRTAFTANGFSIGFGQHEQGAWVAQKLQAIGAVRTSQGSLMTPAESNEILYGTDVVGSKTLVYATSTTGVGGAALRSGKLGWVISGKNVPGQPDTSLVSLCPAYWEVEGRNLRLRTGQEPYLFHYFDVGRVELIMQPGQFCLLGPQRAVDDQDTLDRLLFEMPRRNQMRILVIIFGGQRQIDGN